MTDNKDEIDVIGELMAMAVELGTTAERLDHYCEQLKVLEKRTSDLLALVAEKNLAPETGEFFDIMVNEELMDLVNREGKRPGGFARPAPFPPEVPVRPQQRTFGPPRA